MINMPTARFYNESSHGITLYHGSPDQKITMTSSPYDWLEASFFYMSLPSERACKFGIDGNKFCQSYKDKGFNFKLRL